MICGVAPEAKLGLTVTGTFCQRGLEVGKVSER